MNRLFFKGLFIFNNAVMFQILKDSNSLISGLNIAFRTKNESRMALALLSTVLLMNFKYFFKL